MRTPFAKRLAQALAAFEKGEGEIAREAGVSPGQLSRWKNASEEEGPVPLASAVEGLLRAMPRLNGHWLVTGEGDMWLPTGDEGARLDIIGKIIARKDDEAAVELATLGSPSPADLFDAFQKLVARALEQRKSG